MKNIMNFIFYVFMIYFSFSCTPKIKSSFQEGMIGPNPMALPSDGDCFALNQKNFSKNPRLINISWCQRNLHQEHYKSVSYYGYGSWDKMLGPNKTPPLMEYDCFTKTVSQFGNTPRYYLQKRCKKLP